MSNCVIWEHRLGLATLERVAMPEGAELVSVHLQDGMPTIYYACDPSRPTVHRMFGTVPTGCSAPVADCRFIGTVVLRGDALGSTCEIVFHVFEQVAP